MTSTARLYHCTRCHRQVVICRACDRGNVYCGTGCAQSARSASRKRAANRYQQSRRGRHANAERQSRYRARQRLAINKVTHQGSESIPSDDLLPDNLIARNPSCKTAQTTTPSVKGTSHCHFCGCTCSDFLRMGFIRHPRPRVGRQGRMVFSKQYQEKKLDRK